MRFSQIANIVLALTILPFSGTATLADSNDTAAGDEFTPSTPAQKPQGQPPAGTVDEFSKNAPAPAAPSAMHPALASPKPAHPCGCSSTIVFGAGSPNPTVMSGRPTELLDAKDLQKELNEATATIAKDPDDWLPYSERAEIEARLGRFPAAFKDLSASLKRANPKQKYVVYVERANVYNRTGQFLLALDDCDRAEEADPNKLMVAYCRAQAYNGQGKFQQAINVCNQALERMGQAEPDPVRFYSQLPNHGMGKEALAAMPFYCREVDIGDDFQASYFYQALGIAFAGASQPTKAAEYFTKAIAADKSQALYYADRALVSFWRGQYRDTVDDCDRVLSFVPKLPWALSLKHKAKEMLSKG